MDRYKKGITMVELVVVIALFSILLAVAIPNFKSVSIYKENQELKEFTRDILYARNQAIMKGKTYYFHLDYTNNGYLIHSEAGVEKRYNFINGIMLTDTGATEINFTRSGWSSGGTISFTNSNNEHCEIRITPITGDINIYK